jgi:hypothetical protein
MNRGDGGPWVGRDLRSSDSSLYVFQDPKQVSALEQNMHHALRSLLTELAKFTLWPISLRKPACCSTLSTPGCDRNGLSSNKLDIDADLEVYLPKHFSFSFRTQNIFIKIGSEYLQEFVVFLLD